MKYLNRKMGAVVVFLAATSLLVFYLLLIRWHIYLSVTLFWAALVLMLSTIVYQSLKVELSPSYVKVVLLEIVVTCFVFHLIYQMPYSGLRGYDVYLDMASVKGIMFSGFVMGDPQYVSTMSYFPLIHLFGAMLSLITSLDLFYVVKWVPSLFCAALIPLLYLLVRSIFKEAKIALLSALMFACLQNQILFNSLFVRQTMGLVLALCCLYFYFSAKHSPHYATNYALSIVFLFGTIIAHHLTSFILFVFLLTHFLVFKASEVQFLRRAFFGDNITGVKVTVTLLSVALVSLLAYWTFVVTFPLYSLVSFLKEVFTPVQWGLGTYSDIAGISAASILTIRGQIIYYGFFSFHLIFGFILLSGLLLRAKNPRVETYSFTLLLFLCGLIGFLSLYAIVSWVFPDRFLMFGWLFGFVPLVSIILKRRHKWLKRAGVFLLFAFMLFNIYMINPVTYNPLAEGVSAVTSEEDYALANTFDFSSGKIFGAQSPIMTIYDLHNNLGTIFTLSAEVNLTNFDWIIILENELELEKRNYPEPRTVTIAALERLATGGHINFTNYNKIYESNTLLVFKLRKMQ